MTSMSCVVHPVPCHRRPQGQNTGAQEGVQKIQAGVQEIQELAGRQKGQEIQEPAILGNAFICALPKHVSPEHGVVEGTA